MLVEGVVGVIVELDVVERRYQAVFEELNNGATVTDVAHRNGMAGQTVHEGAARVAQGGNETDPVRVDVGVMGGFPHQCGGSRRGNRDAPDLLQHQVGRLGAEHRSCSR